MPVLLLLERVAELSRENQLRGGRGGGGMICSLPRRMYGRRRNVLYRIVLYSTIMYRTVSGDGTLRYGTLRYATVRYGYGYGAVSYACNFF